MTPSLRRSPAPLAGGAVLAAACALAGATVAGAICYQSPYPSCATGNDMFKSTLVPSSALPPAPGGEPMSFVDPHDGSPRRLIPLHGGRILVWNGSAILGTDFIDLSARVSCCGELGLVGMAVHPDYADNGFFYVKYTGEGAAPGDNGDIVIARYTRSAADPNVADPASAQTVLVIDHSEAGNHNGGWLAFGPDDGYLYISTGDGGNGCDTPTRDAQNINSLRGKMLRLDVNGDDFPGDADRNYAIPPTNPYVGQAGADEVWAIGLRNPFRFSFDRENGDLYIGDVGQDNWEEINRQAASTPAPVNFGWVCREGCNPASNSPSNCSIAECTGHTGTSCQYPNPNQMWDPILCFRNNDAVAWTQIMGGYRYRGEMVPAQSGYYFFGDVAVGQIWRSGPADPDLTVGACWDAGNGGLYGFAEDHLGELYIVNGGARRIECLHDGNPDGCFWSAWGGFFQDDFETGDTTRWSTSIEN